MNKLFLSILIISSLYISNIGFCATVLSVDTSGTVLPSTVDVSQTKLQTNKTNSDIEATKIISSAKSQDEANSIAKTFFNGKTIYEFPDINVSPSNENVFSTPVAWFNGSLYTINIELPDGANNGINLKTVVRKGSVNDKGEWTWSLSVVEDRTLDDRYHTQPSIAIDKNGYIHVAYNMHNMPWQYKISKKPEDISEFEFLGETISTETLSLVKNQNKTPFPNIGTASIPGTQITYPAFFKDRNDDLYITYRFATRPARAWEDRGFAGGIAKYNANNKKWEAIGGNMAITSTDAVFPASYNLPLSVSPFAYYDKWSVYLLRLHFDVNNSMHVSWTWREGGAGEDCSDPSYAFSRTSNFVFEKANGSKYNLPIAVSDTDKIYQKTDIAKFYSSSSISSDSAGTPYIILSPIGSSRILIHYDQTQHKWSEPEKTPWGATEIYIDENDRQWAFASGIAVLYREKNSSTWKNIVDKKGYGWPKIHYVKELKGFFIHTLIISDRSKSKVFWVNTNVN